MCLSTVYALRNEKPEQLCKNIASVRAQDGKLIFTDIMGATTVVDGSIRRIDLMDNFIYVTEN